MTLAKASALTVGFLGTFALGVAVGPAVMDRMDGGDRMVSVAPAPETPTVAPQPSRRATAAARTKAADAKAAEEAELTVAYSVPASQPELHARLKPVLNHGAKMEVASEGFKDAEQFASVAHAARNTEIPFMVLKHSVVTEGRTLESAIRTAKPEIDAKAEARRARIEAQADVVGLSN